MDENTPTSPDTEMPIQTTESAHNNKLLRLTKKRNIPRFNLFSGALFLLILIISVAIFFTEKATKSSTQNQTSNSTVTSASALPTIATAVDITSYLTPKPGQSNVLDVTKLPVGDKKVSTAAKSGYIYSCQTTFTGSGAQTNGSWIHGTTWNLQEKLSVQGSVTWPKAVFTISTTANSRVITGNALPVKTQSGTFPISSSDPAYQIDKNPNSIKEQTLSFSIPLNPTIAASPTCLGGGMIGIALNGVPIFDGLDAGGNDAVAHEVQDICSGHPQQEGEYHYHGPSACLPDQTSNNTLIGYALDGFGIYSMYDANGKEFANADLDSCHGTTSTVMFNGKMQQMYHYVLTREYPYSIGCFRGTPTVIPHTGNGQTGQNGSGQMGGQNGPGPNSGRPSGPPPSGFPPPNGMMRLNNGTPPPHMPPGQPNVY